MSTTHRTLAAIAAASAGVLLLAGCSTDIAAQAPTPAASTASSVTAQHSSDDAYTRADGGAEDDDQGPTFAASTLSQSVAVWDLDMTFAAVNALNGSEAVPEAVGDTDAMPDYDGWLVAA